MGVTVFTDDGNGMTFSGVLLDDGDIKLKGSGKLYLDNDNDSYFEASTDDTIDLFIAGSKDFVFKSNNLQVQTASYITSESAIAQCFHLSTPNAAMQSLSGAGAIGNTQYYTAWTTTSTDAGTLADADVVGQLKKIQMIVDGGDGTLTPTTLVGGTRITFADAGDTAELMWTNSGWRVLALYNVTDGATAPVLA